MVIICCLSLIPCSLSCCQSCSHLAIGEDGTCVEEKPNSGVTVCVCVRARARICVFMQSCCTRSLSGSWMGDWAWHAAVPQVWHLLFMACSAESEGLWLGLHAPLKPSREPVTTLRATRSKTWWAVHTVGMCGSVSGVV